MKKNCELLGKCGFFRNFNQNAGVEEKAWIRMYCESPIASDSCQRKIFKAKTGLAPADNMAPTGKILS